jgi:hypothetical protein
VSGRAADVVENLHDLLLSAGRGSEDGAGRGASCRRDVPARIRPCEEADLDLRCRGRLRHPVELGIRQQEDAAALRDAVDGDLKRVRLLEHGLEAARPLRARDLDTVLGSVGKALLRGGQGREVPGR